MAQLIVSISGIRGVIGDGLGPREAVRFGLAFGTHLGGGTAVLARDSRPSGPMLADAFRAGLAAAGSPVVDAGVLSTPGAAVLLRHLGAAGGAVITASHNPLAWNGIKLMSAAGMALTREQGRPVLDLYERQSFAEVPAERLPPPQAAPDAAQIHVERVLATVGADAIRGARFRVVVDAVNGAGGREMGLLLARLGCECSLIHGDPTGRFGRPPEPVPENLADLGFAVRDRRAAVGFALDPDGDRLSLVAENGRAIGEEYTLALSCRHRLTQARGPLACNLSTSRMMDDVAAEAGVPLYRTPVGEVNVAEAIDKQGCLIGGEGNGGVIDPRVVPVRDALVGAALILEMLASRRLPLSELAAELPVYALVKDKVPLAGTWPRNAAAVLEAARRGFPGARADTRDGLHLSSSEGWLHVRASNTEPILRVMAEAADEKTARAWVDGIKALAGKA
ncbi:MAG: phosphoglucosamine mutase [Planctomycetes bacterium]|nr:phosphoglucosamine mutase [Planctomycetota bacterium]